MILVNGTDRAALSATDRGLAYGDGVFRTMLARDGVLLHWPRHYAKLEHDCAALRLPCPAEAVLRSEAAALAAEPGGQRAIKIIVTRGEGERGYRYADGAAPTRIVLASPVHDDLRAREGVRVRACRLELSLQPALAGVKHLNRLENVLARAEWHDPGIAEGLMGDCSGHVIGGTMTNLFLVRSGRLATPALTRCGVAGVTRERVMEAAARHGVDCEVAPLRWTDVMAADEVFVVNSVAGLWPVRAFGGCTWAHGALTGALQQWLADDDAHAA